MSVRPLTRVYTPVPLRPDFPDGFAARWFHFVRALADYFDLEIVAIRGIWHGRDLPDSAFRPDLPLKSLRVLDLAAGGGPTAAWRKLLGSLDVRRQLPVIPGLAETLQPAPDLAVFFLHFVAPLALSFPERTRCAFVLEEDVVGIHERNVCMDRTMPPLARLARPLLSRWRRLRYGQLVHACARRGSIVAISDEEASTFARAAPVERIRVISNGLVPQDYAPQPAHADYDIGVFGNLEEPRNYVPTRELIELAQADRRTAGLRWLLVGMNPHASLRALAGERITLTGAVPDTSPFYSRVRLAVVPARIAAGSKSTLLKAWALERPVVASVESARGLPARSDENLLIAENSRGMLDAALALLDNPERAARLARAGRRTLVERCDLRSHAQAFADHCRTITGTQA